MRTIRAGLVAAFLLLAVAAWGQAPSPRPAFSLPPPPQLKTIHFRVWPPTASVYLRFTTDEFLGHANGPITLDIAHLHWVGDNFHVVLEAPGYEPRVETLGSHFFDVADTYPEKTEQALHLQPNYPVVVDLYYAIILHPILSGGSAAAACVLGLVLVPPALRRRREERETVGRAQEIERLTARADMTDPLMGSALGGYRIIDKLGSGGMATVYLAVPDENLDEREAVALKVISRDLSSDPEFLKRFNHEVRACNLLKHPAIVQLYASGEQDGVLYMAMERVQGETLRSRVKEGGLPLDEALRILKPILEGVDYAHSRGVIHRDLKPDNVMITKDGAVKVMDFGLARGMQFTTITMTGTAMGTPAYMPPEQIMSQKVDHRADQYSLGIMAYELICGRKPFEGEDPMAVIYQHLTEEAPPLRSCRADVPEAVEAVVMRMVAKDPSQRFPRLDAALKALEGAG